MKNWIVFCLAMFGLGCITGLLVLDYGAPQPEPRQFPPGYGRSPVQYNNYRFDI